MKALFMYNYIASFLPIENIFLPGKYGRWYFSIIENAMLQNRRKTKRGSDEFVYYEKHHVIPSCVMTNKFTVLLTSKEHYLCHLLLVKMAKTKDVRNKMLRAYHGMQVQFYKNKADRYTSRIYDSFKAEIIALIPKNMNIGEMAKTPEVRKKMSENHADVRGTKNPRYGKKNSEETRLRISKALMKKYEDKGNHGRIGKTFSVESRKKMSDTQKARLAAKKAASQSPDSL
jgi:hypothetical protein